MENIRTLTSLFSDFDDCVEDTIETFDRFQITLETDDLTIPNSEVLGNELRAFNHETRLEVSISLDNIDEVSIYNDNSSDPTDFIANLEALTTEFEDDSQYEINITVNKNTENKSLNIYCYNAFLSYLKSRTLNEKLHIFDDLIINKEVNNLLFLDEEINFRSYSISCSNSQTDTSFSTPNRQKMIRARNEVSHFNESANFSLIPHDFYITENETGTNDLTKIFDKLSVINSFIFISDVSEIQSEDLLFLKINGYKSVSCTVPFDNVSTSSKKPLFKIVDWIYSAGEINDKIGLSRNIISISFESKDLNVSSNTYNSIQSNYEIYLRSNVEQYIKVKNKISDHLVEASQKAGKIVTSFNSSFRNNFFGFFSFFFTVLIIRIISVGDANNIFTKEIAYLSFAFLGASVIFLGITIAHSFSERKRFDNVYNNLRKRYEGLLNPDDLNSIFEENNDHEDDLWYIKKNIIVHSVIWLVAIILLAILVNDLSGNLIF